MSSLKMNFLLNETRSFHLSVVYALHRIRLYRNVILLGSVSFALHSFKIVTAESCTDRLAVQNNVKLKYKRQLDTQALVLIAFLFSMITL